MTSYKHVILGGGMVAGYCAKAYVELGGKPGDLAVISADDALPYERPPLSKNFLAGKETEEGILINPAAFYRENGIEAKINTSVTAIDARSKRLRTLSGEHFAFEKLVLSTGAEVRKLEMAGGSAENVLYLRSLADSRRIRDRASSAKQAAVLGGGFIAMEVASVLAQRKIRTTMLLREDRIWKAFFTPQMSTFFENYYTDRGVEFRRGTSVESLENPSKARLTNGQVIDYDLLVAGIGVRPVTALAVQAGLRVEDGIFVNEFLETADPNILAAGDVVNYPDQVFGNKRRRVEHWDNAVSQGQHIAHMLVGEHQPFVHVPYFFSDVFDLSYEFWGDPSEADHIVHRGDLHTNSFSVWWLKQDTLVAAFAMNRPDEERELAPEWILSKQSLSAPRLREAPSARDALNL